jgi:general secretion pathway protein D/MSHA biogenesis protein MshL
MKTKSSRFVWGLTFLLLINVFACSRSTQAPADRESAASLPEQVKAAATPIAGQKDSEVSNQLPVRFQSPSYTLNKESAAEDVLDVEDEFIVKVGADISSTSGSVVLRDIMKQLAALKSMNVSWASDVDQYSYVDVDIRADDDFFQSIDNLLRQRDYFHEVHGNTIVIKYKETRKFHVAMPFLNSNYSSSVGAKVSDNSQSKIDSNNNAFDIWANIKANLDQVLQIWEDTAAATAPAPSSTPTAQAGTYGADATTAGSAGATPAPKVSRPQSQKGYYTIDKPVGLITVTAPRNILTKVENYLNNLKTELYKQISIEAKILEVNVEDSTKVGIDWENLLNESPFTINANFGPSSIHQPFGPSSARSFTISGKTFNLLVSAIEKQGRTKILANPRISVMNGQPALINVGKQVTFVKKVTKTTNADLLSTEYEVETQEKTSGIVMSVVPTIMENNEIILNLIPVTSTLQEPIPTQSFGDAQVGLPVVNVREMSTIVRVRQGEMLVVGGLIDSNDDNTDANVPLLGRLPLIGRLFSVESKLKTRKELVILLKPEIIS